MQKYIDVYPFDSIQERFVYSFTTRVRILYNV